MLTNVKLDILLTRDCFRSEMQIAEISNLRNDILGRRGLELKNNDRRIFK